MPDRLLIRPLRPDIFIEFKRPGQQLSDIQAHWFDILLDMGKKCYVIRSVEELRPLVDLVDR